MTTSASLEIGRLFMLGFDGVAPDPNHWIVGAIGEQQLGGVILFDRNIDGRPQNILSPAQLQELTSWLMELSGGELLIAVDQEGGQVRRLKERDGFAPTISARRFAALAPEEAREAAAVLAGDLARAEINFNLAPVVDLDLNPDNPIIARYERSFGADPERVMACARMVIKAHHAVGIGCCLKHFPGHGSAGADSHLGFVDVSEQWDFRELEPFAGLIREGFCDAVMSAHLVNRRLDPGGAPATLSRPMLQGVLRDQLGFEGLIVTDDLQMKAITGRWGYREAVRQAVLAGADLLVAGNNLERREDLLETGMRCIQEMLDRGELDRDFIGKALSRRARLLSQISGRKQWKRAATT